MSSINRYKYFPLRSNRSTRVLILHPAINRNLPLKCELAEVSLDNNPVYDALSYCWDSQVPDCPVVCEKRRLLVTKNCAQAMRLLRRTLQKVTLWIDSICIDQSSDEERSYQVKMMGDIYFRARNVIIWTGLIDETLSACLRAVCGTATSSSVRPNREWISELREFFDRPYFHRMWTIQEMAMA